MPPILSEPAALTEQAKGALQEWPNWPIQADAPPRVIDALTGGKTNKSWLIELQGQLLVLRLEAANAAVLGIDRQRETDILQALAPLNISPQVLYQNPAQHYSVFYYTAGRQWDIQDFKNPTQVQKLHSILKRIQAEDIRKRLAPEQSKYLHTDYLRQLKGYQNTLSTLKPTSQHALPPAFERFYKRLTKHMACAPLALCHHDLNPENIIESNEGLVILDWEYAGFGLADFDSCYIQNLVDDSRSDTVTSTTASTDSVSQELIYWLCEAWEEIQAKR